ncbi:MAG: hypothetical protein JWN35_3915 [Frankiales bacterium]|nr:hypothetical protein [Frankiales bacterium]
MTQIVHTRGSRAPRPALVAGGVPWDVVLRSWVASRVIVLLALVTSTLLPAARNPSHSHQGLLGWDAAWYLRIAAHGYGDAAGESIRFFPLLPLLGRGLAWPLGGSYGVALLALANLAALPAAILIHRLALREGLGRVTADRAVWAFALAPAAFVMVMGYTEPLYVALVAGLLLALRDRRWLIAAVLGGVAGGLRPTGVVLGVVVLVEALQGLRSVKLPELSARAVAVVAPAAGLAAYLLWVGHRFGDALLPVHVQQQQGHRGGLLVDPLPGIVKGLAALAHGRLAGPGLHLLAVAVALALFAVVARRLPRSHALLVAVTLLLALTANRMMSFERYAASAVPLLLAAAMVVTGRIPARVAGLLAALVLFCCALLAFLGWYVP